MGYHLQTWYMFFNRASPIKFYVYMQVNNVDFNYSLKGRTYFLVYVQEQNEL